MRKILELLSLGIVILFFSCRETKHKEPPLNIDTKLPSLFNTNTFSGIYHEVAVYINKEDTSRIIKIVKEKNLNVNYKDPKYNISLLKWAIANRKYYSCEALLNLGANPNQADTSDYVPPITNAAGLIETSDYLKLLLGHGGNPNIVTKKEKGEVQFTEATPLCAAASARLESVKLLIDNGADINLNPYGISPLTTALVTQKIDIAEFMIINKNADIDNVYTIRIKNDTARILDLLRLNIFSLKSEDYKKKMEVVDYLRKSKGLDYRTSPIPKYLFNNYPKEFLEKY